MFQARYVPGTSMASQQSTTTIDNPAFPPTFQPSANPVFALTGQPSGPSLGTQVVNAGAHAAGAIVGGALGSLIPIPGVGTAVGAALGGAVGPAVVNAVGSVAESIGSWIGGLF